MMSHINIFVYHLAKSSSDPKAVVDLSEQCKYLGMDVVGELGFGTNLALQTSPKNRFMIKGLETSNFRSNTYMQFPLLKKIGMEVLLYPFILTRQLKYYNTLRDLIVVRRSEGAHARNDLYSFVADIKDPETGEGMRLRDIWSEAAFFMPAGGDTTSTALSAAFFYLSRYPDCYQKLASQIRRTFTNGEEIKSGPKLNSCSYLRACIDETLRLSPPISTTLWRDLPSTDKQPFIIDGHVIPPGTQLGVNIYTIHHNPVYFPDPFVSKPERWLDSSESSDKSSEARKISLEAFTPFSLGSRGCAGKAMAYMELSLAMAKSLWYLDFERPEVGKLDAVGEGKEGDRGGRGRKQEFQLRGQFTTVHEGPNLVFRPRGGEWRELQREVEIGMEGELEEE
ncbi:hypothetical protein OCU04_006346 [Sclerotinia nivalis]|uniref:Cytochrome P450 n=1 Tax=Sclerotinia nivalis TaxID=352851 RepID=A0A9X0DJX4_9HELO|nr:hypothetical protein OCU04_006346 [Sclerotinia nivalis]